MAEDSAVNYWEVRRAPSIFICTRGPDAHDAQKYGNVAFDSNQKAVLTSCVLRYKPLLPAAPARGRAREAPPAEEGCISCCFSFTIRRDPYGIPTLIVGNFIKC